MCKDTKKHVKPPEDEWAYIDEHGYSNRPEGKLSWDPSCPVAAVEFLFQVQTEEDVPKSFNQMLSPGSFGSIPYRA